MSYGYTRPDPKEAFRSWLTYHRDLIKIAVEEGFTRDQAIEMLKAYFLNGVEDNTGAIGNNY